MMSRIERQDFIDQAVCSVTLVTPRRYDIVRQCILLLAVAVVTMPALAEDPSPPKEPSYPPLPQGVTSFGAAVSDGWLYVYGGHSGQRHQFSAETTLGQFCRLKLAGGAQWEELPSGPGLQGLALIAHQGKLYRIGGMQPRNKPGAKADNHSVADCARFDPATKKWEALPDLPERRSSHDAVVLGDRIYVVGGWKLGDDQDPHWYRTALVLDLSKPQLKWETVDQPFRRRALTATAFDGKVYVFGGLTPDNETERTVDVYDPANNTWTTCPQIPGTQRNGFSPASCVAGGRLLVSPADGKLWRLTAKGDAWEQVGTLKQPRLVHRLVAAKDDLVVAVGGAAPSGPVALTETVTLPSIGQP